MDTIPEGLRFTRDHEWARVERDGTVTVGISWHAQDLLGDIVFVELPVPGDALEASDEFGVLESVKAASELYAPVTGTVVEVNEELEASPELINEAPYTEGWMVRIELDDESELGDLLDVESYRALLAGES